MSQIPPSWPASSTTQQLYNFCLDHADLPPPKQKLLAHLSATAQRTCPMSQGSGHHPSPSSPVINVSVDRNPNATSSQQFLGAAVVLISLDAMRGSNGLVHDSDASLSMFHQLTETYTDLPNHTAIGPKHELPPHWENDAGGLPNWVMKALIHDEEFYGPLSTPWYVVGFHAMPFSIVTHLLLLWFTAFMVACACGRTFSNDAAIFLHQKVCARAQDDFTNLLKCRR